MQPNATNYLYFEVFLEDDSETGKFDNISYGIYSYPYAVPSGDFSLKIAEVVTDATSVTLITDETDVVNMDFQKDNIRWTGYKYPIYDSELATKEYVDNFISGSNFLALTDTPSTYVGQTLKHLRVNAGETGVEFISKERQLIFVPREYDTDKFGHRVYKHAGGGTKFYSATIPYDFVSLVHLHLHFFTKNAMATWTYTVSTEYGKEGEQYNNHMEGPSITIVPTPLAAGELAEYDITSALTGIEPGDIIGIELTGPASETYIKMAHLQYIANS